MRQKFNIFIVIMFNMSFMVYGNIFEKIIDNNEYIYTVDFIEDIIISKDNDTFVIDYENKFSDLVYFNNEKNCIESKEKISEQNFKIKNCVVANDVIEDIEKKNINLIEINEILNTNNDFYVILKSNKEILIYNKREKKINDNFKNNEFINFIKVSSDGKYLLFVENRIIIRIYQIKDGIILFENKKPNKVKHFSKYYPEGVCDTFQNRVNSNNEICIYFSSKKSSQIRKPYLRDGNFRVTNIFVNYSFDDGKTVMKKEMYYDEDIEYYFFG